MSTLPEIVDREKKNFASSVSDEKAWFDWLEYRKPRGIHDLRTILSGNFRMEFKKRALFIMLVPSFYWIPWPWKPEFETHESYAFGQAENIKDLPMELVRYVAKLVLEFSIILRASPDLFKKHTATLYSYNEYMLQLFTRLPDEEIDPLFPYFSLNDITVWSSPDESSGYNPFETMLRTKGIRDNWKDAADRKMREIVRKELSGKAQPRASWEDAFTRYADIIGYMTYRKDDMPYDTGLFTSQIDFLVGLGAYKQDLFRDWHIDGILDLLSDDKYSRIRIKFINFVTFGNKEPFRVRDEKGLATAQRMLTHATNNWFYVPALTTKLYEAIEYGKKRIQEDASALRTRQSQDEAVLEKMR